MKCMPSHVRIAPPAAALVLASGCATYAPPLRTTSPGAPGRVQEREMEVGGAAGGTASAPVAGGPQMGYGIRNWVAIEAGGEIIPGTGALGWVGPRFTVDPWRGARYRPVVDFELQGGAGVGGETQAEGDDMHWTARPAGGGAAGIGFAYHLGRFAPYARARVSLTAAEQIPVTAWTILTAGAQWRFANTFDLFADVGYARFDNAADSAFGLAYRFGFAVLFSVWPRQRT